MVTDYQALPARHHFASTTKFIMTICWVGATLGHRCCALDVFHFDPAHPRHAFAVRPGNGEIYAAEAERVTIYDRQGKFLRDIALSTPTFHLPGSLRVNGSGDVLVFDQSLKLFDAAGALTGTFSPPDGTFISPATPLGLGHDGHVFVARPDHVDVFTKQGAFERSLLLPPMERRGLALDVGPDGLIYLLSDRPSGTDLSRSVEAFDASGAIQRNISLGTVLRQPGINPTARGLRVTENGNLLIQRSDQMNIDVYEPNGQLHHTVYSGVLPTKDYDVASGDGVALLEFINGSRIRVFSQEEGAQLTPLRPLLHFVDGPFGWPFFNPDAPNDNVVDQALDEFGVGRENRSSETAAGMFRVPGEAGLPQDVAITWRRVSAGLEAFGIFDPTTIDVDPTTNPRQFAEQALRSAQVVFRREDLPQNFQQNTLTKHIQLTGGATVAFFYTGVRSDYDQFLALPDTAPLPFFSVGEANPGGYDQMLAFAANGRTLVGFEDLSVTRDSGADYNLSDDLFSFDIQLIAIPEPATASCTIIAGVVLFLSRRWRTLP